MAEAEGGELRRVRDLLENAESRRNFVDDPETTLRQAGIDPGMIPDEVRSVLSDLSEEELAVLVRVRTALGAAGAAQADMLEIF